MSGLLKFLVVAGCLLGTGVAAAQLAPPGPGWLEQYAHQFRPPGEADRLQLANQVSSAWQHLQTELAHRDPIEQSRWNNLLKLDRLGQLLESDSTHVQSLRDVERNFYGLAAGLDADPLVQLREALTRYVSFLVVSAESDLRSEFETRLRLLDEALADPEVPDALQVAWQVEWLMAAGQVPALVTRLQQQFDHPCIVVDINPDFLAPWLDDYEQQFSHSQFATHRIVGVPVSGMSHITAAISPALAENPDRATLRLQIDGVIESPANESRPDPQRAPLIGNVSVALQSNGQTTVNGFKEIYWDGTGLVTEPAHIECQTSATVEHVDISRKYRFPQRRLAGRVDQQIRKKTYEEVQKKSPLANRQAAELAEREISEQLDAEVQALLDSANGEINQFYRAPLMGLGVYPVGTSRSGPDTIRLGFRGPNCGGIGAPDPLPDGELAGDVRVSLHETMTSSLWAGFLRGRQIDDRDFRNIHRELRGFVPQALRISGNPPWSVRLHSEMPLEIRFRHDRVMFTFRMDSLTVQDQRCLQPFLVSARYRVVPEIDMPRFERDGDVTFQWLSAAPPDTAVAVRMREFVLDKFEAFFAPRMHMDGMSAPVGSAWGTASQMKIITSQIDNGWWHLTFKARDLNQLN